MNTMNQNQNEVQNSTHVSERKQKSLIASAKKHEKAQEKALRQSEELRKAAKDLPPKKRAKMIRRAEKFEVKANAKGKRAAQLTDRANRQINDKEWKRIGKSRFNHWIYDRVSAVVTRFRPKNPLREEGMRFREGDKTFENKGRIFLGGTKAMNRFVDEQGRDWLCKEAVTCLGTAKPMGALVTEAASKLQQIISPDTAVHAFAYRDESGRVCGSLQERLNISPDALDLFKWQTDTSAALPEGMTSQILREHVTDWLLCNFDTKGENFLVDADGKLRGIDKEQAFSYLDKPETQTMSRTYSPNPNEPLYNTIFSMYARGEMDLDLMAVKPYIDAVMAIKSEDYRALFADVVEQKAKGDPIKAAEMSDKILARRDGLQAEYERFFGELAKERGEAELVGKDGRFSFAPKAPEPAPKEQGKEARRKLDLSEKGIHLHEKQIGTKGKTPPVPKAPERTVAERGELQ